MSRPALHQQQHSFDFHNTAMVDRCGPLLSLRQGAHMHSFVFSWRLRSQAGTCPTIGACPTTGPCKRGREKLKQ